MMGIKANSIDVNYGDSRIINALNVTIPLNKTTSIIGPNGCGKSTLLKALSGIITYRGTVTIDCKNIQEYSRKKLAQILSMLPQKPDTTQGLRVEELVAYGRNPYTSGFKSYKKEDYEKINWAMEATNTTQYKKRFMNTLSGGQKQRVWVALCLAQDTDIIFLDEPTTYLDIAHQLEILEILNNLKLKHNKTIVMVIHDLNQASRYSDYLIALKEGEIICEGTSKQVITKEVLEEIFHINAEIIIDKRINKPICSSFDLLKY